jgi:general secretion pathway protein G
MINWRKKYSAPRGGFSLIELLIVIAVVGILSGIAIPWYMSYREKVKIENCKLGIKVIETAVKNYGIENNGYPNSLADVKLGDMTDPWGRPYEYLRINGGTTGLGKMRKDKSMVPINTDFDLYSVGPDGKSAVALTAKNSHDDIIRANDGQFIGLASEY